MTGIEKIVEKINEEATYYYNQIVQDGKVQASELINKARQKANDDAEKIIADAEKAAELKITIAKSYAESITRSKYLEVKNAILNDVIAAAYERIQNLSDSEYFDLLFDICLKNIQKGDCEMHLCQKDIDRLPKDFEDKINMQVYENSAVYISKEAIKIESGFVLVYETFEIDCTFKSIFDQSIDELTDVLCPILFN